MKQSVRARESGWKACFIWGSSEPQTEQRNLKWTKVSEPPWKNAPWTPLKVNEVNNFFGGGGYNMWAILIFQKNGSTLVYFGLGCAVPNLQTPIRGHHHHPVLYLQIQVAEKYSTAMCYITVTKARFIELLRQLNLNFQVNKRLSIAKMWNVRTQKLSLCRCCKTSHE